jgi:RNA-directed DNA polymerase
VSLAEEGTRTWEQELMERVADEANLVGALGRVCANQGSAGIDQMSVAELRAWMSQRAHRAELRERLISGSYQPKRQSDPFCRILTPQERWEIYRECSETR